ncbi:MAG: cyanophycinase [Bacteroidota bacterium]
MKRILFVLSGFLFCIYSNAQTPATIGPEKGSLIIVGGGNVGPEIWSKFVELAGGAANANIIIITTADEDSSISRGASTEKEALKKIGVQQISFLHTRDPKIANTEEFIAPLKKATGIWFRGGRQWKLADAYLHTRAQKAFTEVLERGGVIAGTSAGATIQGSFMVRGDTKGNTLMIGDHTEGLDFIHHVTIDQHHLKRNRMFDLLDVIKKYPDLLGIGLDESTAIVVQKDLFEVIGVSYVCIYDIDQINGKLNPGMPNSPSGPFYFLSKGQKFDLKLRRITR